MIAFNRPIAEFAEQQMTFDKPELLRISVFIKVAQCCRRHR